MRILLRVLLTPAYSIDLDDWSSDFRTDNLPDAVEIMNEARRRFAHVFPILGMADIVERIQGITTFAPHGQYVLGPVPNVEGLHLAPGCAALGIAGAAAGGKWIAETITTGEIPPDLTTFNHGRFGALAEDCAAIREAGLRFDGNYYSLTPGTPDRRCEYEKNVDICVSLPVLQHLCKYIRTV